MGVLRDHDIQGYINRYGTTILAETGTGTGTAISHALQFTQLTRIYSCDIDADYVQAVLRPRFAHDARVTIYPTTSESFIASLLDGGDAAIIPLSARVLWFLDSHFPGFDLHKRAIDDEKDLNVRLPLQRELDLLQHYGRAHDVVLVDDLRIYENGPFQGGTMKDHGYEYAMSRVPLQLGSWETTHTVTRDYRDSGYLVMTPRS